MITRALVVVSLVGVGSVLLAIVMWWLCHEKDEARGDESGNPTVRATATTTRPFPTLVRVNVTGDPKGIDPRFGG